MFKLYRNLYNFAFPLAIFIIFGACSSQEDGYPNEHDHDTYFAGSGLSLNAENEFSLDPVVVQAYAQDVCFDTEAELTENLDSKYLPAAYTPAWSDIRDIPPEFADGIDNTTLYAGGPGIEVSGEFVRLSSTDCPDGGSWQWIGGAWVCAQGSGSGPAYAAGSGLNLSGTVFSLDQETVTNYAQDACYDTQAELTGALDDHYADTNELNDGNAETTPVGWADLSDVPSLFAPEQHGHGSCGANRKVIGINADTGQVDCAPDISGALFAAVVASDGSGDFSDIASAVDAGAKSIFVKNGTYALETSSAIDIGNGTRIEGETRVGVVLSFSDASAQLIGDSDNEIRNMTIDRSVTSNQEIVFFSGRRNVIENLTVSSLGRTLYLGADCRLSNSEIHGERFALAGVEDNCIIRDNKLSAGTSANSAVLQTGRNVQFIDNHVYTENPRGRGISIGTDSIIANNRFESAGNLGGFGISSDSARIANNEIIGFGTGIDFSDSDSGGVVQGNIIRGSGVGIEVFGASNSGYGFTTISGNSVLSATTTGIEVGGQKITVADNKVYNAGADCFRASNQLTLYTITGNFARHCGDDGFDLSTGFDISILSNNIAADADGVGFRIESTEATISGNNAFSSDVFQFGDCIATMLVGNLGIQSGTCTSGSKEAGNSWNP